MPFGSLRSSDRIREFKGLGTAIGLIVMIMVLTGCGLLPFGSDETDQSATPPPPLSSEIPADSTQTQTTQGVQAPVTPDQNTTAIATDGTAPNGSTGPAGYVQVPVPPAPPVLPPDPFVAAGPLQLGPDGTLGSLGLSLDGYFDDTAAPEERLSKIERVVTAMHRDLKTLAPPLQRLITVENDIQALVSQLAELAQNKSPPRVMDTSYSAVPLHPPPAGSGGSGIKPSMLSQQSTQRSSGGHNEPSAKGPVTVQKLRLGEHPDKTRIVLDVSGAATYRYDLDNEEHLLVIELPNAGWSGATQQQWQSAKSPILASYTVSPMDGGGSRVVMQLKKNTSVSYETVLKPDGKNGYRIVIDLKK